MSLRKREKIQILLRTIIPSGRQKKNEELEQQKTEHRENRRHEQPAVFWFHVHPLHQKYF